VDIPAVGLDDRARDRESKAATASVPALVGARAVEAFEDLLEFVGWDPGAGVADGDLKGAVMRPGQNRDPVPAVRVGHSIADEVAKDLREPGGIRP
jgi:hypothetical protein